MDKTNSSRVEVRDTAVKNSGGSVNPFVNNNIEGSQQKLTFEEQISHRKPSRVNVLILSVLMLTTIALLIPLVIFVVERNQLKKELDYLKTTEICTLKQCIKSAANYLNNMDQEVDPCSNFFEYSCGGWIKQNVIPDDKSSYSAFTVLREEVGIKCKELLEREPTAGEAQSITSSRNFYKSCLDMDAINKKGAQPLIDLLVEVGGWPVLGTNPGGNWNKSEFHFETFWALVYGKYYTDLIISSWVGTDDKNSSSYILKLDQPGLGLGSRDYYIDAKFEEERASYLQYMVDVIVKLGGDEETARTEMEDVMAFETTIANMSIPKDERRDNEALYNIYTLEELLINYPQINWTMFYDIVMPEKVKPIQLTERIVNKVPSYLKNLTEWLEHQDSRVIANYMVWRLVSAMVTDLDQTFIQINQRHLNVLLGTTSISARWKRCVREVDNMLQFATGRMYVEENFPPIAKEKTVEMIANLKTAFKAMLESNEWLEKADIAVAAEKVKRMKLDPRFLNNYSFCKTLAIADKMAIDVGYPDWIMDNSKLDEEYKGLDFVADNYFGNSLLYRQWSMTESLNLLRDVVDKTEWTTGPADVNAYFSSSKNRILFPAGILQPPFYHQDLPWYSNYGGIGVVIGHEITHGFDDGGRQYDKDGNLVDWWSAESVVHFKARTQCIVDQYAEFVMPENTEKLNGVQTQGENIADNGGLKEAYKAYKDSVVNEPHLPGLNLNRDQMFFLTFGQIWCSIYRPERVTSQILSGSHSPGRYRVIGTMQNNEAFARAFNCSPSSFMNPVRKCNVW